MRVGHQGAIDGDTGTTLEGLRQFVGELLALSAATCLPEVCADAVELGPDLLA